MAGKILVVDDEDRSRKVFEECLTFGGYEVLCAASGEEGLEQLQIDAPDLVITDMLMPTMNGHEFSKRVREMSDVPIIMITGLGIVDEADEYQNLIDVYLPKPIGLRSLLDGVETVLSAYPASESTGKKPVG